MAASANDLFQKLGSSSSLVNTPKTTATRAPAGATLTVDNCNWDTTTGKIFATYQVDTSSNVIAGTEIIWKGVVNSSTSIGSLTRLAGASDTGNAIGDIVELLPASAWGNNIVTGILTQHNQDGTHGSITTTGIANTGTFTQTGTTSLNGSFDGWVGANESWAFASSTTITVPTDATTKYNIGDFVKITQSATVKYFVITSLTSTVLTVSGLQGVTVANSAITANAYSKVKNPFGANSAGLPQTASVATSQTTTTTTYTDLATTGPAVTATIGQSGVALVVIESSCGNSTAGTGGYASWVASGANTVAAADAQATGMICSNLTNAGNASVQSSTTYPLTGLTPGSTTFTAKYRAAGGGTATFLNRTITVIPL